MERKGFTLIELLAVIVVLAIIALIATPIVMNVIKKASAGAAERSAERYLDAVETAIATHRLENDLIADGTYNIVDGQLEGTTLDIEVSGTKPVGGQVTITNGQVDKSKTQINYTDHTVTFEDGVAKASEKGSSTSELAELCNYVSGTEGEVGAKYTCDLGDGERNFYVLEVGSNPITNSILKSNEVALILEGNYDMETLAWCASGQDNVCAADGLNAKLDEIVGAWTKLDRSQIGLPSAEQIATADEKNYLDAPLLTNEWLYNWPDNADYGSSEPYGYWTSTPSADSSYFAWFVEFSGAVSGTGVGIAGSFGVRPVITLSI